MDINNNSIRSVFIECIYINSHNDEESVLSTATGFLLNKNKKNFLITNKHVVTGKNTFTNENLDEYGRIPILLRIYLYNEIKKDGTIEYLFANENIISLYKNDEPIAKNKLWLEHHKYGGKVDIAAIDITSYCKVRTNKILETKNEDYEVTMAEYDFNKHVNYNFNFKVTDDVYIIGFPFSYISTASDGYFPIWTKGTIASEYNKNLIIPLEALYKEKKYYKVPAFLVDSRTRKGQSGSPVIASIKDNTILLGIYSGRTNDESDLGYVWKTKLIDEIISY